MADRRGEYRRERRQSGDIYTKTLKDFLPAGEPVTSSQGDVDVTPGKDFHIRYRAVRKPGAPGPVRGLRIDGSSRQRGRRT